MAGGDAGASATLSDVVPQAGKYCYMVVPFDENGVSDATPLKAQTLWVGEDTSIPTLGSVTATVVDDTTVEVDFDAPVTGGNGGYLDPSKLSYRIVRKSGSGVNETLDRILPRLTILSFSLFSTARNAPATGACRRDTHRSGVEESQMPG